MSGQNNDVLMIGAVAVGLYLYSRRGQAVLTGAGRVPTMPASAGTGMQQIGMAALNGFLRTIAAPGVTRNNTPLAYVPSVSNAAQTATDYYQSGTVQDVANDFGNLDYSMDTGAMWA